ncbi:putative porin [uncultured Mucilaginibacter sp.]|uniref:putative porin n=1 Tax=uncultured Mucilaginibacter sp. TaxID=797541 RepID=UPI0025DC4F7A|nr:putative porin [uncultured Mucilaginibacter sp.]
MALLPCLFVQVALAQYGTQQNAGNGQVQPNHMRDTSTGTTRKVLSDDDLLDTLRKQEEHRRDSVIFSSRFIRVTNERLLNDSTQIFPLDTGLTNFENYSPLYQIRSPKISIGGLGLAERNLLFEPDKTIGFDVGLHYLDAYLLLPPDIQYYRARVPITSLYLVTSIGNLSEQVFKIMHTQNIKPNWNIGLNFNRIGSNGVYARQHADHLGAAFFTWYESPSKRYNLLANLFFNNLKAPESGSTTADAIFTDPNATSLGGRINLPVRLNDTRDNIRDNGFYIKQFYYLGRVDSLSSDSGTTAKILPTQRIAYTFFYNIQKYKFLQNDIDTYKVFPDSYFSQSVSQDSLVVYHFSNEISYSFYLRGKSVSFVKNELKLDLGIKHDLYSYSQFVLDTAASTGLPQLDKKKDNIFQDITLKAKASYRFSDRMALDADFQQIAPTSRDAGNYLYSTNLTLSGGDKVGKVIFGAYTQNSSPPLVATSWVSNHFMFNNSFKNTKTTGLSVNYINQALQLDLKAEYFLINNYLYFEAQPGGIDATPMESLTPINLIKLSAGKNITLGRFHFDNFAVYQKTDQQSTLRTPDLYIYSSLYYNRLLFQVLNMSTGINVRYNSQYTAPSYAVGLGQFYNGPNVQFSSYPVATVFMKATLKNTNFFIMYDYANQGLQSQGYYTVNRYPMPDASIKFGVLWNFYN